MKNILILFAGIIIGIMGVFGYNKIQDTINQDTNRVISYEKPKPLLKYSIENLSKRSYQSNIVLDEPIATTEAFLKYKFHFDSDGKKVTGLITFPVKNSMSSVIVQFRGYAPMESYYPGCGTAHSAEEYAKDGFITIAPDFLGYGGSDAPASDVWEARFETYTTALNLLAGIKTLPMADTNKIGIWGHSNGGQIALAVLEIIGKKYPTVLWAPQSLPFPYSIIYYMDENGGSDRDLRKSLVRFEEDYDSNLYNPLNYLEKINAPIQLHQGLTDEQVPAKFADQLFNKLKSLNKDVTYYKYPNAGHNFLPIENWNKVIDRDIDFYLTEVAK